MRSINPKKLKKMIQDTNVLVVQWGTDRCIPCRNQEKMLDDLNKDLDLGKKNRLTKKNIDFVKVDIDKYPSAMKDFKVKDVYPSLTVFKNGANQPFKDSFSGKTDNVVYGQRNNIKMFVIKTLKSAKLIS